jgi:hypothetical protein
LIIRLKSSCYDSHLVNFVCVASSGQVVDRSVESEKDRTVSSISAKTLSDLVADVSCFDVREDECGSVSCYR